MEHANTTAYFNSIAFKYRELIPVEQRDKRIIKSHIYSVSELINELQVQVQRRKINPEHGYFCILAPTSISDRCESLFRQFNFEILEVKGCETWLSRMFPKLIWLEAGQYFSGAYRYQVIIAAWNRTSWAAVAKNSFLG